MKEETTLLAGGFVSGGSPSRTPTKTDPFPTSAPYDQFRELLSAWPAVLTATITLLLQYLASSWTHGKQHRKANSTCCQIHQQPSQRKSTMHVLDLVAAIVLMTQPRSFALAYALAMLAASFTCASMCRRRTCSCTNQTSQARPLTGPDGQLAPRHAGKTCSRTDCHGCYHPKASCMEAVDTAGPSNKRDSALLPEVATPSENLHAPSCSKDRSGGNVRVAGKHGQQEETDASAGRPSRCVSTRAASCCVWKSPWQQFLLPAMGMCPHTATQHAGCNTSVTRSFLGRSEQPQRHCSITAASWSTW